MTRRRVFARALLGDIFIFGLLHSILSTAGYLPESRISITGAFLLALPFFLMSFLRRRIGSFILFMAVHAAFVALPFWLPLSVSEKGAAVFALLVSAIYSLIVRLKGPLTLELGVAVFGAVTLCALDIFLVYLMGMQGLITLYMAWAFVFLLGSLISDQTGNVDDTLDIISGAAHQPIRSILRFNNALMAVFGVLAAGVALFSGMVPLGRVLRVTGRLLRDFLVWLLSLFSEIETPPPEEPEAAQAPAESPPPPMPEDYGEPPAWLMLIYNILEIIVQVVVVAGITLAIFYGIYKLYRLFHERQSQDGDIREYIGPALEPQRIRDFIKSVGSRMVRDMESDRIRRRYARKIRRQIRKGANILVSDTTGEIYGKLPHRDGLEDLTAKYNYVRYGPENSEKYT